MIPSTGSVPESDADLFLLPIVDVTAPNIEGDVRLAEFALQSCRAEMDWELAISIERSGAKVKA